MGWGRQMTKLQGCLRLDGIKRAQRFWCWEEEVEEDERQERENEWREMAWFGRVTRYFTICQYWKNGAHYLHFHTCTHTPSHCFKDFISVTGCRNEATAVPSHETWSLLISPRRNVQVMFHLKVERLKKNKKRNHVLHKQWSLIWK